MPYSGSKNASRSTCRSCRSPCALRVGQRTRTTCTLAVVPGLPHVGRAVFGAVDSLLVPRAPEAGGQRLVACAPGHRTRPSGQPAKSHSLRAGHQVAQPASCSPPAAAAASVFLGIGSSDAARATAAPSVRDRKKHAPRRGLGGSASIAQCVTRQWQRSATRQWQRSKPTRRTHLRPQRRRGGCVGSVNPDARAPTLLGSFGAGAGRCPRPRTRCIGSFGAGAGRGPRPRSLRLLD